MKRSWDGMADAIERKIQRRLNDIHANCSQKMEGSVKFGSQLTGAPGQPVDTEELRKSWILKYPTMLVSRLTTNMEYAGSIEEGIQPPYTKKSGTHVTPRPMTLRSEVGGFHSVKMTKDNFQRVVDQAVREEVRD